ncbi:hydantoinase/oxoprolinase family protein [Verminephrobacter eiseniae]|uniref:5-oxoprolinase (ATP-hydrolyzing) n=1 Tax=Verminephrobacter eiseniae (strain EF01-2) TaxID=391735 RepID=A1WIX9_VEREI|nr:hydantoinase/oxoprolinase family protein [Verminephrobacter eiseniae]ABM57586.1 5-oxoprolinase (ATP-hydrolyzing) [Verminephrobacter eiseniae EF01-2]MCW5283207.1 hydantoinase/oxoprolinase family protein [Verminephrobacter eiseniae]MCW5303523.1 hydantoinase/oxoprolinase family protein [Verminephrobacter eiseniae]MCW8179750.1 hydantoinase/oxoprolinase family protein [Verminephrobacter eiseniae]MCW8188317.1 hydantoinase/oxoprolinase family protein [Verminephrobacter eiseniae]
MKRVSVDIGGTFTDCFLVWNERKFGGKALTTHHNLAVGFQEALGNAFVQAGVPADMSLADLDSIRYATTLGTNALIERGGPRVGLLVTAGFEATVPLSRGRGYGDGMSDSVQRDLPNATRPQPLVPMALIAGVRERVDGFGAIVIPLDVDDLRAQLRLLVDQGAQAFVVALTNSVVNAEHERLVEEIILDEYPSHMLGALPVTLSHRVSGRKSEYARTNSAIINAYLHAVMYHGLAAMEQRLRDASYTRPMMLVHNSGGMAQLNSTSALQTIHSGPVAGISAAEQLAAESGIDKLVCADMGGTSFDISLVVGGDVKFYDFNPVIDRWLCTTPMIHLLSLGAGGGSIARVDAIFHTIEVGPESAGSEPGPACFNQGGTMPTVTDSDLVLGYLDPLNYAAGTITLNLRRAQRAIEDEIVERLGMSAARPPEGAHTAAEGAGIPLSVTDAALAIKAKVDANMAIGIGRELRAKGYEPADFTLLAYGGNGPLHACGIADAIGMKRIFVPPFSAVFSALGAGNLDQIHIHEHSKIFWLYDPTYKEVMSDFDELNALIESLETGGREDMLRQGLPAERVQHRLELDMRYGNQLAQTSVVAGLARFTSARDVLSVIGRFAQDYQRRFGPGSAQPQAGVVITAVRVVSFADSERIDFSALRAGSVACAGPAQPAAHRRCHFGAAPGGVETPVFTFESLVPGQRIAGPAVVVSRVTTILIEPQWHFVLCQEGAAWMTRAH